MLGRSSLIAREIGARGAMVKARRSEAGRLGSGSEQAEPQSRHDAGEPPQSVTVTAIAGEQAGTRQCGSGEAGPAPFDRPRKRHGGQQHQSKRNERNEATSRHGAERERTDDLDDSKQHQCTRRMPTHRPCQPWCAAARTIGNLCPAARKNTGHATPADMLISCGLGIHVAVQRSIWTQLTPPPFVAKNAPFVEYADFSGLLRNSNNHSGPILHRFNQRQQPFSAIFRRVRFSESRATLESKSAH